MSRIEVPWKPRSAKSSVAAVMSRSGVVAVMAGEAGTNDRLKHLFQ
jgi:hypothetical protein